MADTKISDLPAAAALGGAEPVPVVQSGATRQTNPTAISTFVENNLPSWDVTEFVAGVDYTAGVSTSVTIPAAVAGDSDDLLRVYYEAGFQAPDAYSVSGTTLTFSEAIPTYVSKIIVYNLS